MDSATVQRLADALLRGEVPDSQPWDLSAAVQRIADDIPNVLPVEAVRKAAASLIKHRHYDPARTLAKRWAQYRGFDPLLCKHLAQALINLSALDEAQAVLDAGLPQLHNRNNDASASQQIPEYEGLQGRVFKQRYVATRDPNWLVKSRERYLQTFLDGPSRYWHGINAAALRVLEEREGLASASLPSSFELATKVLDSARRRHASEPADAFAAATMSEAHLALGNCDEAEFWLYRFMLHPAVKPFDIEAYDRQIREIWSGNPLTGSGSCADRLSSILSRHIVKTERRFLISAADVPETKHSIDQLSAEALKALEKNFSGESTLTLDAVRMLLTACEAVGCVSTASGERVGTGFLVAGLEPDSAPVFVTNAHIISREVPNAVAPEKALVSFEVESRARRQPVFYEVGELLFTSPPGDLGVMNGQGNELDVTIVRLLNLPQQQPSLKTARNLPVIDSKSRVYVVGHPRGSGLQISLQDSRLLDIDDDERLVHYRTPTDPGSSGSPVFNAKWEVVALHHGGSFAAPRLHGSGTYEANEGISLQSIKQAWAARG